MNTRELGNKKESEAVIFLEKEGYNIIERNYYGEYGEVDIIGTKEEIIVFFEVKYRKNQKFGFAEESISKSKKIKIVKTAMEFLEKNNIFEKDIRFDVIALNGTQINWIKNSFWGDEIGF